MLSLKQKLSSSYTYTAVSHTAQRDPPPDHLCQEDFRYKKPVQPFVEPSTLIPLLGHKGAIKEIIHIGFTNNFTSSVLILIAIAASMVVLPLMLPPLPPPPLVLLFFPVGIMAALVVLAFSPSENVKNVVVHSS
ncbi:hypothetical protein L195_g009517 [Trifolium pratense]|uniref:Uncharacterized protein n=1 Tax=Trifolium pratense TaxID=57577 RepID=A0A2K3MW81_TRIPR|nr:hypothetical protein L195_g017357 [Trifolium pratense]PNX95073.1 hypothetical protein L195_g018255 [Trifolium pratense]PNY12874.1 hypothetical protein L195_g009517 [Trifolium pratense]